MACTRPINAYQAPSGKIFFQPARGLAFIQVPCGQCIACRLARSREWAIRCTHEAQLHEHNCWLTLTYDNDHLPEGGTLVKADLQKFFKRYRKRCGKLRYYACGEYGEKLGRPHYHAIIFGHDFADKKLHQSGKFPLYVSETLSSIWPLGHAILANFSFESAAYTARYCCKKITGKNSGEYYGDRIPEFSLQSTTPGIGYEFFIKYYDDIVNHDRVVTRNGMVCKPPRYYDKLLAGCDVELLEKNKEKRKEDIKPVDPWRLADIDEFNIIKFKNMIRKYENA